MSYHFFVAAYCWQYRQTWLCFVINDLIIRKTNQQQWVNSDQMFLTLAKGFKKHYGLEVFLTDQQVGLITISC